MKDETLAPLSSREKGYQMFAKFSPDSKYVGFVRQRNLFVVEIETMKEIQLTTNGSDGGIINGTTDWVYEEEFHLRDGWSWSPDSKYISFVQLDETEVCEYNMINNLPYKPTILNFKFPYPGEKNSDIRVGIFNLDTKETSFLETGTWKPDNEEYEYIPRLGWTPSIGRQLYKVGLYEDKGAPVKISKESGTHNINMSEDFKYYIDSYSDHDSPRIVNLYKTDGTLVKTLIENKALYENLEKYNLPAWEFFTVPGADGTELHAYMMRPHDFDPNKKYPLLMFQYGGAAGQSVTDSFDPFFGMFHSYVVESLDAIVACVDNRGTPGYGKKFLSANYKAIGTMEPEDQIAVAKQWGALPYIDENKIGIWGWSYGGFNTFMSMVKYDGPTIFKYGIAVAPGGEEELYDTIYTERYMLTPQKNPEEYKESNPLNFVDGLADNQKLLIAHGLMDDNVHFQNTVRLVSALQKAKKQFNLMVYPGGNHSLRGTGNRFVFSHLFTMMSNFIQDSNAD